MTYEMLSQMNFSVYEYSVTHFNKVFDRISVVQNQKETEIKVITEFFKEFKSMEDDYKNNLINICVKYQTIIYETFKDEKIQQFFQILFNNLLQKSDIITKSDDHFKSFNEKMNALNSNFKKNINGKISLLESSKNRFEEKIKNSKLNYSEYLKLSDMNNEECYKKIDKLKEEESKLKGLSEEIKTCNKFEEKFKVLDKIQAFSADVGKTSARELKNFVKLEKNIQMLC